MFALPFLPACHAPNRADRAGLALGGLAVLAALASALALRPATYSEPQPRVVQADATLVATDDSLLTLREAAENTRARLLGMPGVGAVKLTGLIVTGLEVDYTPARLASLGITPDRLRMALPAQADGSSEGHLRLSREAAQDGAQAIANLPVYDHGRHWRIGDIATVARMKLDPVSVLIRDGHPAVHITVVPAPDTPAASLTGEIAAVLGGSMPPGIAVR